MLRFTLRLAATASALALAAPAFAQDAPPPADDEILVTAQRENQSQVVRGGSAGVLGDKPAEDLPFSIKSYNAALVLNQQPQTLGQLLENDPSIRTSYGFGNAAEQFVIRGFTLYGDDIGLDGLYGLAPRQLIAPELYEQVQVLNGASAFLNGAAPGGTGIGGSVNLIPKRAGDVPLTRITANYASKSHIGGSFDVARRFGDGRWGLRVNGALRSGDVAVDDEFRRTAVIGGALDYRSDTVRMSLDLAYQRVEVRNLRPKVIIGTTTIPAVPGADHNYGQAFSYSNLRDVFGIAKGEWDVTDNAMLYASFGARDGSEDGIYDGITVTNALTGAASGNALYVPRTDNNEAAMVGLRVKLGSAAITHEINFGGAYLWQVNRNAYDFLYGPGFAGYATNLYDTPDVALPSSTLVGGDLDNPYPISRTRLGSMFASDTIGLLDGRVLLTAGLRLQKIKTSNYSYAGGALDTQYSEEAVTPVLGLVVKPVPGLSLFANRIEGLSQGPTAPIDPNLINPGEVFAPYKSTQYEVGGKLAIGALNLSLAAFQTTLPTAFAAPDPAAPGFLRFDVYGEQRNRGLEFSVDGELTTGLRLIAGASLNDAKLRDTPAGANDGNKAVGVPDYLVNANIEWDTPFLPGATLTGRFVQTGKQQVNAANTLEISEWTRFDLGARYVALLGTTPLTLRVNVDNVANKRYWASAYDAFNAALLQGAPRTFKLSASLDL
ncbi:TonB-dependent receptor [Sphingomonas sp. M1-B02]|uniref:TonB-dependent receptor n=1 Tax=Sphingomonas sp. M1-B02 TaxID=3114300 RepID=UPI00223E9286|nr:TonB-dependent receptor [Sphingomonas sp. S6-11]UZK66380.1 TonB-dependent receptor [Sphingomonas sp. S6-11]